MGVEIQMVGFQRPIGANDTLKELRAMWSAAKDISRLAPKFPSLSSKEQDIEDEEWLAAKTGVYDLAYWHYDFGIHFAVAKKFLGGRYEQAMIELTIDMLDAIVDDCIDQTAVGYSKGPLWGPFLEDKMLDYIKPLEDVQNFLLTPVEKHVRRVVDWTY